MKRRLKFRFLGVMTVPLVLAMGCNADKEKPNIELIQDMMVQPAIKSQGWDIVSNAPGVRVPPADTVPLGRRPYPYVGNPEGSRQLRNPLEGQFSAPVLATGQEKYRIYCQVCHGASGAGDGPVAAAMLAIKPPALTTSKIREWTDGRIYHVITEGQGTMGPYGGQIFNENDRWAVVNYIRVLQKNTTNE